MYKNEGSFHNESFEEKEKLLKRAYVWKSYHEKSPGISTTNALT